MSEYQKKRDEEREKAEEKQFWKRVATGAGLVMAAIASIIILKKPKG
jgi:hypothetical protein